MSDFASKSKNAPPPITEETIKSENNKMRAVLRTFFDNIWTKTSMEGQENDLEDHTHTHTTQHTNETDESKKNDDFDPHESPHYDSHIDTPDKTDGENEGIKLPSQENEETQDSKAKGGYSFTSTFWNKSKAIGGSMSGAISKFQVRSNLFTSQNNLNSNQSTQSLSEISMSGEPAPKEVPGPSEEQENGHYEESNEDPSAGALSNEDSLFYIGGSDDENDSDSSSNSNPLELIGRFQKIAQDIASLHKGEEWNLTACHKQLEEIRVIDSLLIFEAYKIYTKLETFSHLVNYQVEKEEYARRFIVLCLGHIMVLGYPNDVLPRDKTHYQEQKFPIHKPEKTSSNWLDRLKKIPTRAISSFGSNTNKSQESPTKITMKDLRSKESPSTSKHMLQIDEDVQFVLTVKSNHKMDEIEQFEVQGTRIYLLTNSGKTKTYEMASAQIFAENFNEKWKQLKMPSSEEQYEQAI